MRESRTITLKLPCWENPVTITITGKIPQESIYDPLYVSDLKDLLNTLYIACACGKDTHEEMSDTYDYLMKKFY